MITQKQEQLQGLRQSILELLAEVIDQETVALEARDEYARSIRHTDRDDLIRMLKRVSHSYLDEKIIQSLTDSNLRARLIGVFCEEKGLGQLTGNVEKLEQMLELAKEVRL